MRVSFGLPTCMEGMMYPVPFATADQIVELAIHAEKLGYHSVWGNDHMTTQQYVRKEFDTPPELLGNPDHTVLHCRRNNHAQAGDGHPCASHAA